MAFTKEQQQAIDNLNKFLNYFTRNSNGLFEQEAFIAKEIINYINSLQSFTNDDATNMENSYNLIKNKDHLNGSGWFDFQLHLGSLLYKLGYNAHFNSQDETLTITKIQE